MFDETSEIAVVGAGAWGTALACVMARNHRPVHVWGRDADHLNQIRSTNTNERYLPGIRLPAGLVFHLDLEQALEHADIVLFVLPVASTQKVGRDVLRLSKPSCPIVCCSKGIDAKTGRTPTQTLQALDGERILATLSGPSFAADVARGLPTAVVLASSDQDAAAGLSQNLSGSRFRIYAHEDVRGVELGGALKNVVAIAVGVCRGLGLGASAEAAVTARGFNEMIRIATALGARSDTLHGLSGMGDLVLSCAGEQSRNFRFGKTLGEGADISGLPLAEGTKTVFAAAVLSQKHALECAIVEATRQLVAGEVAAADLVEKLLSRPLRHELGPHI